MKIILPQVVTKKDIHVAAAYCVATGSTEVIDAVLMPSEGEISNINCDEVRFAINNNFSKSFCKLIALYIISGVLDPLIDESSSSIDAIVKVADVLRSDYKKLAKV